MNIAWGQAFNFTPPPHKFLIMWNRKNCTIATSPHWLDSANVNISAACILFFSVHPPIPFDSCWHYETWPLNNFVCISQEQRYSCHKPNTITAPKKINTIFLIYQKHNPISPTNQKCLGHEELRSTQLHPEESVSPQADPSLCYTWSCPRPPLPTQVSLGFLCSSL